MKFIFLDIETRSLLDIKEVGSWVYVHSPYTQIIDMGIYDGVHHIEYKSWDEFTYDNVEIIMETLQRDDVVTVAHNGNKFDFPLLRHTYGIKIANPLDSIDLFRAYGSMATISGKSGKASLDYFAKQFDLCKDHDGGKIMMSLSKPRRGYMTSNESLEDYFRRCKIKSFDEAFLPIIPQVADKMSKYRRWDCELIPLLMDRIILDNDLEQIDINRQINWHGIRFDMRLANVLISETDRIIQSNIEKCGVSHSDLSSTLKFKSILAREGVELVECNKGYLNTLLEDKSLTERQRALIELRLNISKRADAKLKRALNIIHNGRLYGLLAYHAAHTGRWGGQDFQPHNLFRGEKEWESFDKILNRSNLDSLSEVSALIRLCLLPDDGYKFHICDYAGIEARVLAWMADDEEKLEGFRNGIDFYKRNAIVLFNLNDICEVTDTQRQVGKIQELGCGYGAGDERIQSEIDSKGADTGGKSATEIVNSWRDINYLVAGTRMGFWHGKVTRSGGMWKELQAAFESLIRKEKMRYEGYKIVMERIGMDIHITLPSGRKLYYRDVRVMYVNPQIDEDNKDKTPALRDDPYYKVNDDYVYENGYETLDKFMRADLVHRGYRKVLVYGDPKIRIYGGKLVENIDQAIANDILRYHISILWNMGINVSFHVHDEIVSNVKDQDTAKKIEQIMSVPPEWASNLPLAVEGFISTRYCKKSPSQQMIDKDTVSQLDYEYFVNNRSIISDEEYDKLAAKVDLPLPSDKVDGFIKVVHNRPMLSIQKSYDIKEVEKWISKKGKFVVEPKVDGVALKLIYNYGELQCAITRGDGSEGDDVTLQARTFVQGEIPYKKYVEIVGEVFVSKRDFEKYSGEFKNARNFAAGSLKTKDINVVASRPLTFIAHGIAEIDGLNYLSYNDIISKLKNWEIFTIGFHIGDLEMILSDIKLYPHEFEIDGAVIKMAAPHDRSIIGTKYYKDCIAYKFSSQIVESVVENITYKVGKTGDITPVAHILPVELTGSTISKVTLHNIEYMCKLGIGLGAKIQVHKAGEIIPQVYNVLESVKVFPPISCPSCGWDIVDYKCHNDDCQAKINEKIKNFCKIMKIKGMGDSVIDTLQLRNVLDLYKLGVDIKDMQVGGKVLGHSKAIKILQNIENSRKNPIWQWVASLGIDGIGPTIAKKIRNWDNYSLTGKAKREFESYDFSRVKELME